MMRKKKNDKRDQQQRRISDSIVCVPVGVVVAS